MTDPAVPPQPFDPPTPPGPQPPAPPARPDPPTPPDVPQPPGPPVVPGSPPPGPPAVEPGIAERQQLADGDGRGDVPAAAQDAGVAGETAYSTEFEQGAAQPGGA